MAEATGRTKAGHDRLVTVVRHAGCAHGQQAVLAVKRLAERLAVPIQVQDVVIQTDDEARIRQCLGSPTVLVGGRDVEASARQLTSFGVT